MVIYDCITAVEYESLLTLSEQDYNMFFFYFFTYFFRYFMDIRLYKKAKAVADPFDFAEYRKKKIREKIEKDRETNKIQIKKLPKVNKDLALKLMNDQADDKKKKKNGNILEDNRFKALFENPDFEVDKNTDEYRLLNPVLSRLDQTKKKEVKKKLQIQEFEPMEEQEDKNSDDEWLEESEDEEEEEESSDDDHTWTKEMKTTHKQIQREHRIKERKEREAQEEEEQAANLKQPKMFELRQGEEYKGIHSLKRKLNRFVISSLLNCLLQQSRY